MIKLFESFSEIKDICEKYEIENYTINSDGSIDVNRDTILHNFELEKIPLNFNHITGYFSVQKNQLTSLKGCPKEVGDAFSCSQNKLTSLEGAPRKVGGNFYCHNNQLTSLEGATREVGGNFECNNNRLTSLEGAPQKIGGNFYCGDNQIWTFEGAPEYVNGEFGCYDNPIWNIWILFKDYSKMELFNYYDIIREVKGKPAIVLDRLNDFLEEIGKDPVKKVIGYINI